MKTGYKIVRRHYGSWRSCYSTPASVEYFTEKWTESEIGPLMLFKTERHALDFARRQALDLGNRDRCLFACEFEEYEHQPRLRMCVCHDKQVDLIRDYWDPEKRRSVMKKVKSMGFPEGTVLAKRVRLTERIL